jgi:hypothetical protein
LLDPSVTRVNRDPGGGSVRGKGPVVRLYEEQFRRNATRRYALEDCRYGSSRADCRYVVTLAALSGEGTASFTFVRTDDGRALISSIEVESG